MASGILGSAEFQRDLVTNFFRLLLNRTPDDGGLAFFSGGLRSGQSDQQILAAIAGSGEFFGNV